MLERAIEIAVQAHKGQIDKAKMPYVTHLFSVMNRGQSLNEKIVGVLHDLIEDTSWTLEMLRNEGFSEEIIEAVRCITKLSDEEDYSVYLNRVKSNPLALRVKLHDLQDNMNILRMEKLTEKDMIRLNKYLKTYRILLKEIGVE
jgi:(p)ppGpp synthase/HD superfamily hydrolase